MTVGIRTVMCGTLTSLMANETGTHTVTMAANAHYACVVRMNDWSAELHDRGRVTAYSSVTKW